MAKHIEVTELCLQHFSAVGDGMNLEICCPSLDGAASDEAPDPIAWFRADVEGEIKFVVETPNGIVSMPLHELERAIIAAKKEVHSEAFYDDPHGGAIG